MLNSNKYWIISLNALVYFLLAYLFITVVQQFSTALIASLFDYKITIYHDFIAYHVKRNEWYHDAVKLIFSTKPFIAAFFGIVFYLIYLSVRTTNGLLKQFFMWGYLYGLTYFFGSILFGGIINTGFGNVLSWAYIRDTGKLIHTLVAIAGLIAIGLNSPRSVLLSANTYFNNLKDELRPKFMLYQLIIPLIIGLFIIILLKIPLEYKTETYEIIIALCLIVPVLITILRSIHYQELFFDENPRTIKAGKISIIVLIIFFSAYRLILGYGIFIIEQ